MSSVFLLYGENEEAILDYENKIIKDFLKEDINNFNLITFDMLETSIEDLLYECQTAGFFSEKKVVIANNCVFFTSKNKKSKINYDIDTLTKYVDSSNKNTLLILKVIDNVDSRKKIVKDIKTKGKVKEFINFNNVELLKYIVSYIESNGKKISKDDAEFFIEYSKLDLLNLKKEVDKLSLLDSEYITKDIIKDVVIRSLEYDIFSLTNFLFDKNYEKLRELYESLKIKSEDPISLCALIIAQLRIYYKVKILLLENFSQKDIATKLSIHPYRIQLAIKKVSLYDIKTLYKCMSFALECDRDLKSSYIDKYIILDIFINKLITILK